MSSSSTLRKKKNSSTKNICNKSNLNEVYNYGYIKTKPYNNYILFHNKYDHMFTLLPSKYLDAENFSSVVGSTKGVEFSSQWNFFDHYLYNHVQRQYINKPVHNCFMYILSYSLG